MLTYVGTLGLVLFSDPCNWFLWLLNFNQILWNFSRQGVINRALCDILNIMNWQWHRNNFLSLPLVIQIHPSLCVLSTKAYFHCTCLRSYNWHWNYFGLFAQKPQLEPHEILPLDEWIKSVWLSCFQPNAKEIYKKVKQMIFPTTPNFDYS